jgi:AraC family transcriptional activator of pobA
MQKLPLINITQSLEMYKEMHAKNPSFGMDIFADNFKVEDFVIVQNNGKGSRGVPIRCEHYICILTLKGGSTRNINQHTYTIESHSLQLLVPGVIHDFEDIYTNSEFFVLLFNRNFLANSVEELLNFHHNNPVPITLDGLDFTKVVEIYEQLNLEYKNKKDSYKEVSQLLLTQLMYLLKREKLSRPHEIIQTRAQQISSQFLCLVEEHFQTLKSVQEYADILELTPKHLSTTIKESLQNSALYFIHKRLIKEVQYLLCYSSMSIKQIASTLNFENSSELGRFFKRYEGVSPKAYQLKFS